MPKQPRPELPLVARARSHGDRTAIVAAEGAFTYHDLLDASARVAAALLAGRGDLEEARVAFLAPAGFHYTATQWGVWRAGGVAVPLAVSHPPAELEYVILDTEADIVVVHPDFGGVVESVPVPTAVRVMTTSQAAGTAPRSPLPAVAEARRALMVYTSGTTGRPKGVVTTHANIAAQVTSLVTAWEWRGDDHILLVLPLHHVHGIINVLTCALWAGARCQMLARFDAQETWDRIGRGDLTLFMAVPTVYRKLIAAWEAAAPERRREYSAGCARMRLMVSGSAALPVRTLEQWREISGHVLLERYGMTEIGMALSNPLHGERRPGFVGRPLPGVEVRLGDAAGGPVPEGSPGEIEVRGPGVFLEYWRRPDATAAAFRDGWFRSGDVAVVEQGAYRILGRTSVDIIKTGGYKVSALEIEEVLRTHPAVAECAVVGVDDPEWGERVCAAVELRSGRDLTLAALQTWAGERLAPYKLPRALRCVAALPRNALGKVTKPDVAALFRAGTRGMGEAGASRRAGPRRVSSRPSSKETLMPETFPRGRFIWHELMVTDPDAAVPFYTKVVGWKVQSWEHDPSYRLWTVNGTPMGGLMRLTEDAGRTGAPPHWLMYVAVPDVDATVRQATSLGGRVHVQPQDIPVGRFAVLADPQGATFAVFKPAPGQPRGGDDAGLGDFSWHELATTDWKKAWDFYRALFGWEKTEAMDMGPGGVYQMYGRGRGGQSLGGMYDKPAGMPAPPHWLCYIKVASADKAAETVKRLGGRILNGPMDVPGGGRIAQCLDPQGTAFALHSVAPAPAQAARKRTKVTKRAKARVTAKRKTKATKKTTKRKGPARKRRR